MGKKFKDTIACSISGNSATATKATQDSAGQQINTTYIKGLSVNGKTITYTKGNGTTGTITTQDTNTTYSAATQSAAGLMSAADKIKLDGIAKNANNYTYTLPAATANTLGGVKIGSNITVSSGVISLSKANVTSALGYTPPTTNTTYNAATQSAAGLMSAADKKKLDGIASGANNYTYTLPSATSSVLGGVKIGSNITVSSGTISLTKSNVTTALGYTPPTTNTTYSTGTASTAGLTKLYTGTGTATDGTMTQSAIKSALDGKAGSSHGTHLTLGTSSGNAFRGDYGNTAYNHSQAAHAPSNAQKNSDITKAEIEAKLTGAITTHTHTAVNGYTIWTGSQSAYNNLSSKSNTTLYFIK